MCILLKLKQGKTMRFLLRLIGFTLFLLPLILIVLVFLALQPEPLVENPVHLNHTDIARAKIIINKNDPRKLREGQQKTVTLSASDLSIALNYLLTQFIDGGVETSFSEQLINIDGTAILPSNPLGKFLNLKLALSQEQQKLVVKQVTIGMLEIPSVFSQALFSIYADSAQGHQMAAVANMLQAIEVNRNQLKISYTWNANAAGQVKDLLVNKQDQNALRAYQEKLADITNGLSRGRRYSFTVILSPMFSYATERSKTNDPVSENRALLIVLAAYIRGNSIESLTGAISKKPQSLRLTLNRRHDFVQHFIISAGLTVTGGDSLANAIGLYKEYQDQKGSSGFSFTDLAADRAGVRLANLAIHSEASAKRIQKLMAKNLNESSFMPKTNDLPEHIAAATFKRKYQNGQGPEYQRIVDLIEKRIEALAIN